MGITQLERICTPDAAQNGNRFHGWQVQLKFNLTKVYTSILPTLHAQSRIKSPEHPAALNCFYCGMFALLSTTGSLQAA